MSMTLEQVVTQLQQEVFNLRAQVAAESGLASLSTISEGYSESHWRERSWTSEGTHWTRGGFPTVVEEDGGILRWGDQGV